MYWIFERDLDTKIYRESSPLSSNDIPLQLRLNPLPMVKDAIAMHRVPLVVLKPLVESQNALTLLEHLPKSRILWMYRHYKDVAASNLRAFGIRNGINDLRPIVQNQANNWRSENTSEETRATLKRYFREDMQPLDAAALFWYARNRLFFEMNLDKHPKAMLCQYESLGKDPSSMMRQIYRFLDSPYPGDHVTKDVHAQSIGKGHTVTLSADIEALCDTLLEDLNQANLGRHQAS